MTELLAPIPSFAVSIRRGLGALVTGTVAVGAVVARRRLRARRVAPTPLPPALDADVEELRVLEGLTRYYVRRGTGHPFVLLPGLHLAGSAMDVKPLFDRLAASGKRPIYVPDWLGFGLSERPDRRYVSGLYQRQLTHLLEQAGGACDVVAFGLSAEYAAAVAVARPDLIRRMVFVAPSGFSSDPEQPLLRRVLVGLTSGTGAFRLYFTRQSNPEMLTQYFAEEMFYTGVPIPDELFGYALLTTHIPGADHAPQRLAQGLLDMHEYVARAYESLTVPTLLILPALTDEIAHSYELVPKIVRANPAFQVEALETGLMPQWERPDELAERIRAWLSKRDAPAKRRK